MKELSVVDREWKDTPGGAPMNAILEVYQQCLALFMSHFPTYAPILSTIVKYYDTVIEKTYGKVSLGRLHIA